jgi:hypothetical protein
MGHRFEDTAESGLTPAQVRLVLEELHARMGLHDERTPDRDVDGAMIADIAEATGLSIPTVCEAVEAVQRGDREAEVSRVLRELEEPTFRVERPGHAAHDPLSRHFPWASKKITSSILDDVRQVDKPRRVIVERKEQPHEKALNWLTVGLVVLVAGISIFAILASFLTR